MARVTSWLPRFFAREQAEQKSIYTSAAFMLAAGQPSWMRREFSRFADEGYARNVIAHRSIAMIATAAASVPWKLSERRSRSTRFR